MTGLRPQKANGFECVDDDSTPSKERAICVGSIIILLALLFCMFGVHVVEGDIPRETTGMRPRTAPSPQSHRLREGEDSQSAITPRGPPAVAALRALRVPRSSPPSAVVGRAAGTWWRRHGMASMRFSDSRVCRTSTRGKRAVTRRASAPRRRIRRDWPRRTSRFNRVHGSLSRLAVARVRPVLTLIPMRSEWCRRWWLRLCPLRSRPHRGAARLVVARAAAPRRRRGRLGLPLRHIGKPKLHTGDRD